MSHSALQRVQTSAEVAPSTNTVRLSTALADNQLGAIEATLHAKEHDHEELQLMSHDASHARDVCKAELLKLSARIDEERKARDGATLTAPQPWKSRRPEAGQHRLKGRVRGG